MYVVAESATELIIAGGSARDADYAQQYEDAVGELPARISRLQHFRHCVGRGANVVRRRHCTPRCAAKRSQERTQDDASLHWEEENYKNP